MEMFNPKIIANVLPEAPEWSYGWPTEPGFYWVQLTYENVNFEQVPIRLAYIDSDAMGLIYPPDAMRLNPSIDMLSRDMMVAFTIRTVPSLPVVKEVNNVHSRHTAVPSP